MFLRVQQLESLSLKSARLVAKKKMLELLNVLKVSFEYGYGGYKWPKESTTDRLLSCAAIIKINSPGP